ncbi:hypothetical protein IB286_02770 [Spongiibacter sp. KMU-158]|uniref:Tetratricopeptide repeat protein n=1 Tax=Spongiibacter pelagi TaxID=2760804 RepID=A0A927GV15_9GAMM|nr:hypothetical protein [Spongiibacter pelagi]MBD2857915.1 hypothetical protein [Spongiibacter pelagi]
MQYRHLTAYALLSLSIGLSACSTAPLNLPAPHATETQSLLHLEDQFHLNNLATHFPDPLAITPEMKAFVKQHVPESLPEVGRLRYLTEALRNPRTFGISYHSGLTLTAAETFEQKHGNCISLTVLFIALAKEAKLNAWVNEVVENQDQELLADNRIAVYKHINAVVQLPNKQVVVDFSDLGDAYLRPQQRIPETRAAAQYYSNRGVDMLGENQLGLAYQYFKRALQLDTGTSYIWGNLGTLLNRMELYTEAEIAFREAYSLDNNDHTALGNLERLYLNSGKKSEAKQIRQVIVRRQLNNPYWHYGIAKQAFEEGKTEDALRSALRAIRLDNSEYRFYYFAAQIYRELGDRDNYHKFGIKAAMMRKAAQDAE